MLNMTTSLVAVASLVLVGGCSKKKEEGTAQKPTEATTTTPPPPPAVEAPKPLTGAALADKYKSCVDMLGGAKWDDFKKECVDASFVTHDYSDGSTHKADELVSWFQSMKAAMPDWKLTPQLILVNGRNVLAIELMTATHTGTLKTPMGDVPATNKKIGMLMFHRLAINEANKATEEWAYSDPSTMMGQLGLAPPGSPPTRAATDKGIEGAPIVVVAADDEKEKTNLGWSKKAIDALNGGKVADMMATIAPDAMLYDQAAPKDAKGTKEIEADLKMWFGSFKDAKVTMDQSFAAGDYVVEMGKFSGTHDKDIGKLKKTGKSVNLDFAEVVQMKDGKAINLWRFHSGMQFAMQLGLMGEAAPETGKPAAPAGAGSAAPAPKAGDKK
jgi:predicted ester cyclase